MTEELFNSSDRTSSEGDVPLLWKDFLDEIESHEESKLLHYLAKGLIFEKEDSLMLRCRMTGAELTSKELEGLASIADLYGGGYADVTTRANFQIREIAFKNGVSALRDLLALEIAPAVPGLNNLRNVTVSPTSGFGKGDLYDVIPLAREIHHAFLYNPDLQGLPGKFNVALDSGGLISVASEANDIGLLAIPTDEGVKFRLTFADIRKGETVSTDSGWMIQPNQVLEVVSAAVKVFLQKGNFTTRLRSRLKYLIESLSVDTFKEAVENELSFVPQRTNRRVVPPERDKTAHCGLWEQCDSHFYYIGIVGAAGRFTVSQMRSIASIANLWGDSKLRLTTMQTCILPFIKKENVDRVVSEVKKAGLSISSQIAGSIVACTGSKGCSYSATDTKTHSKELIDFLADDITLTEPVNIHFTGCPFSCAQTYIGDIGLLGVKSSGKECYHVFLGGGADQNQTSTKILKAIPVPQIFNVIKQILTVFQSNKECEETFNSFVHRVGNSFILKSIHTQ